MLGPLKRTISMRRFFWLSTQNTYINWWVRKYCSHNYLDLWNIKYYLFWNRKRNQKNNSMLIFVWFDSYNFSVMSGRVFLGWTSTKQRITCLAQGHNTVPPVRLHPPTAESQVKHSTKPYCSSVLCWNMCIKLASCVNWNGYDAQFSQSGMHSSVQQTCVTA